MSAAEQPPIEDTPLDSGQPTTATATFAEVATLWQLGIAPGAHSGLTIRGQSADATDAATRLSLGQRFIAGAEEAEASAATRPVGDQPHADYRIEGAIGAGGMGVVHAARQTALDRLIAIKTMRADAALDRQQRRRFIAEARVTGDLQHPNIVPLIELAQDQRGRLFFSMRRVEGRPWNSVIRTMSLADNIGVLLKVADAVAYAHHRGLIHRDLKPENVMIGEYGEVLVMDWGLAVPVDATGIVTGIDRATAVAGTPAYLAPEMANGDLAKIGVASDIYLLGAILYEIVSGRPPHQGRTVMACLTAAARNQFPPLPDGEYARIATIALATDPMQRPAAVKALQAELRACQAHAESVALGARAAAVLRRAEAVGDYAVYARAVFGYEEALVLWSGNAAARAGLMAARRAYAGCALAKGDLDLAATQLDTQEASHAELRTRLGQARTSRAEAEASTARLAQVEARIAVETSREWQLVFADDFSDAQVAERWDIRGGQWEWNKGELRLHRGQPTTATVRLACPGDLRLEFTCHQESAYLNDVSCFLAAIPNSEPVTLLESGYQVKYGAFDNTLNVVFRPGRRLWFEAAAPLRRGERYRVRLERIGARISLTVNDRLVFAIDDADPLTGPERTAVGLIGWQADARYHDVRLYRLAAPMKDDLLETAERHLAHNHYTTARDLFADVLSVTLDPARRQRAESGVARADMLRGLHRELPALRARVLAAWPGAKIALGNHGLIIDCANGGIDDLTPLAGMPVGELNCGNNRITSLEPLRGMPLIALTCADNRITTLEPLRGMPLGMLFLFGNQIEDLEPLRGMPLVALHCNGNRFSSLEALRGMRLSVLNCDDNQIEDLAPLRGMRLDHFCANLNRIADLEPLRGMPLTLVECNGNRIADLEPLRGAPLTYMEAVNNRIASLDPLRGAPLIRLWVANNRIADLEPLSGMPLVQADVSHNPLRTLGPLASAPPTSLLWDCASIPDAECAQLAERWGHDPGEVGHAARTATLLALRREDRHALRAAAQSALGKRRLLLPRPLTWPDAAALCQRLGGRLAHVASPDENRVVVEVAAGYEAWIGLRRHAGVLAWEDGRAPTFSIWRDSYVHWRGDGDVYLMRECEWGYIWDPAWLLPCIIEWDE